ncbi:SDR family NAD(P)-dependent oxidoreductase [uncultured Cohaesibacter sp.]|uniref:SDR family NAD(P)-dependent oxidoreductase n=1 Tax=uncultured Cohaesibacter sp. TaxID=1002546 RepID=UPI002AA6878C|nr:SDR family NAD(P)-dependent oxidoreductase [uncultured Cohaesibacter sp.]
MRPRSILITGASRGLGASLAHAYAAAGVDLILTARSVQALKRVCADCQKAGAKVQCLPLDLAEEASIDDILEQLEAIGLPDLLIANAGVYSGRQANGLLEPRAEQDQQLRVNLTGTIQFLDRCAQRMKDRGSGHLVLISSLAAIQPQPDSPAYSASKAGLAFWGRAMAEDLADHGVQISIVYPGHIESQQTAIQVGALPGLMSAPRAAEIIRKGIGKKRTQIFFPQHLYWLIRISNLLPGWLRRRLNRPFRYHVARGDRSE